MRSSPIPSPIVPFDVGDLLHGRTPPRFRKATPPPRPKRTSLAKKAKSKILVAFRSGAYAPRSPGTSIPWPKTKQALSPKRRMLRRGRAAEIRKVGTAKKVRVVEDWEDVPGLNDVSQSMTNTFDGIAELARDESGGATPIPKE
jgi:hypothetical protein